MTYTFWHSGILIGESNLEERTDGPRRRSGVFRPTPYGLELYPRLCGVLTAGNALRAHFDAIGKSPEDLDPAEIETLLDTNPAGQKILDVGRMLSEVEMRAPSGNRLEWVSIGFIDTQEFQRLFRETEGADYKPPPAWRSDAPRYFVSLTLRNKRAVPKGRGRPFAHRH